MATPRQIEYIRSLMIQAGHAHPRGYLSASSRSLPHGPSMRERRGDVGAWAARLTVQQASEVIDTLLRQARMAQIGQS